MNCNNPILKTQSEFLADIKNIVGRRTPSDQSLIVNINQALVSMGDAGRACVCVEWESLTCGQCEYDLPCCNIDRVIPEVKGCGCDSDDCWSQLNWWDIRCGKLITDGQAHGQLRLTIFARNPEFSKEQLVLAKPMIAADTELWINGRVDNLPAVGWVKVCAEWLQYRCAEHRDSPPPVTIHIDPAPIDPVIGIPGEVTYNWGVDPALGYMASAIPCGTHTVLSGLTRRCNALGDDKYDPNTPVEFGLALQDYAVLEFLQDKILANVYRSLAAGCTSGDDRQFYLQMMADSDARALESRKRRKPAKPVVKIKHPFTLQSSCCGYGTWAV